MSSKKKQQPKKPQETPAEIRARQRAKKKTEKKARMKKRGKICGIVFGSLLAVGAVLFGVQRVLAHTGWLLHHRVAVETDHYSVDQAMLCYYYEDCRQSFDRYQAENPEVVTYDPALSLKDQRKDDSNTWYTFFLNSALDSVYSILQICETAYDAGFKLSSEQLADCKQQASAFDGSKLPKGVRTEDVENSIILRRIATEYRKQYFDAVPLSDEDIAAYYAEHKTDYMSWDMLCYSFSWASAEENETETAKQKAVADAAELAKCTTPDEFRAWVYEYVAAQQDEEYAAAAVDDLPRSFMGRQYAANAEKWVTEESPAVYDTFTDLTEQASSVQVFMLMTQPEECNGNTADIRVIALSAKKYGTLEKAMEQAEELKAQAQGGDAEAFGKLASKYSEDATTRYDSGKMEAYSGSNESYGTALKTWALAPERKPGDMMTDTVGEAVLLFYYERKNPRNVWQNAVYEDLYNTASGKFSGKLRAVTVTEHEAYEQVPA